MRRFAMIALVATGLLCASPSSADEGNAAHALLLQLDAAVTTADDGAHLHLHDAALGYERLIAPGAGPLWYGLGATVGVVAPDASRVDAAFAAALARVTVGHSPPFALEVGATGAYGPRGPQALGHGGVFLSMFYLDVGCAYEVPIGPLDHAAWMAPFQLAARAHLPLAYDRAKTGIMW
jgi:hypothetical protein